MTFGVRNLVGVHEVNKGNEPPAALVFKGYSSWSYPVRKAYDYLIDCHVSHALEMIVAVICYFTVFQVTFPEAHEWRFGWVARVVAFNVACEFIVYPFWHWITYASTYASGPLKEKKYNPSNQYESKGPVGFFSSSSGQLQREVLLTTLGWLQSSVFQCVIMHLWAIGAIPYYLNFWDYPLYSVGWFLFVTYWREFHFYWIHRFMHPWWNGKNGLLQGDVGAFMYRYFHSIHHKSYNPGPWSGLAMHPVEHFCYYTVTLLPLVIPSHPLHFLYAKFHADIAPIGGHDGYATPGGNGDFHWLHHAKFECNYGVPLIDFDRLFGTWVDYEDYKKIGSLQGAREASRKKK